MALTNKEYFTFEGGFCGNRRNKIFPIDYSLLEFQVDSQLGRRMTEALSNHELFHPVLCDMFPSRGGGNPKEKPAIPVEANVFFIEFAKFCKKSKQCGDKGLLHIDDDISKEKLDRLVRQFFRQLCDSVTTDDKSPDVEFTCHVLMQNADFTSAILDDLWSNEFQPRVDLLKVLAKRLPIETHLSILKDSLTSLDSLLFRTFILYRTSEQEKIPGTRARKQLDSTSLQKVLEDLLSYRKKEL